MTSSSVTQEQPGRAVSTARAARLLWLAVALVALGGVVVAIGLQHLAGLDPCPLCIIQRYAHLAVAALALVTAFATAAARPRLALLGGVLTLATALAGAAVASHQVWMQQNPVLARCSLQLFQLVNEAWPALLLPGLFRGAGDCLANDWIVFGLSMPAWSLVMFCAYLIAAWPALVLGWQRGR